MPFPSGLKYTPVINLTGFENPLGLKNHQLINLVEKLLMWEIISHHSSIILKQWEI